MNGIISDYLYKKASHLKIPLFGCFELSPVCNFSCKMCYVRKTPEQVIERGRRILDWTEWIRLAKECKTKGTLFLLLSGGEPFLYPNFKELYTELHKMAFVLSINTNGTMINSDVVEWLKENAPSRINITLYGSSKETYEKVCGSPDGYERAINAIMLLKEAGIPVVINASMIPENSQDMKAIIDFGKKHKINTRISTYMFPPMRRSVEETDSRFSPEEAAIMNMNRYEWQMENIVFKEFVGKQIDTLNESKSECENNWNCEHEEFMKCRAGRSSFWVSWDGTMTACGLMPFPLEVYPFEETFDTCWEKLTTKVRTTPVLNGCQNCNKKHICNPCVAMIHAETGTINKCSSYMCEMTDTVILKMKMKMNEWEQTKNET